MICAYLALHFLFSCFFLFYYSIIVIFISFDSFKSYLNVSFFFAFHNAFYVKLCLKKRNNVPRITTEK